MYLLGKGDFILSFESACHALKQRDHGSFGSVITDQGIKCIMKDLNFVFQNVWTSIFEPQWDVYRKRFILSLARPKLMEKYSYASHLFSKPLMVAFDISWPLDLFMTMTDISM